MILNTKIYPSFKYLYTHEWSSLFEHLQRLRMVMGRFRYGALNALNKPNWDRMNSVISRAKRYQETGNDELLVDIANLCMLEFEEGSHPNKHFKSVGDNNPDRVGVKRR